MIIQAPAERIVRAFCDPATLAQFWLASSSGPLAVGTAVRWYFMVPGAQAETIATQIEPRSLSWRWEDGTTVDIEAEEIDGGTAVTLVNAGFQGTPEEIVETALNATEGFALVLADLKTLLETGKSAGIVRDKARLIELRQ
jgi:uncharacterized protein YndB with AHSA1/START domain